MAVLVLSLSSCGKKEDQGLQGKRDPSSPAGVVEQFNKALFNGEYDKAYGLLSESSCEHYSGEEPFGKVMAKLLEKEDSRKELRETKLMKETIGENTAVVKIRYPQLGNRKEMKDREIMLVNENGEWKIDLYGKNPESPTEKPDNDEEKGNIVN